MPFDMWLRIFDNYLLVINAVGTAWPDAWKRATLLHCLGVEGQRIFYALPDTGETYDTAVAALKKQFMPKINVVVERHTFRKDCKPHTKTYNSTLLLCMDSLLTVTLVIKSTI